MCAERGRDQSTDCRGVGRTHAHHGRYGRVEHARIPRPRIRPACPTQAGSEQKPVSLVWKNGINPALPPEGTEFMRAGQVSWLRGCPLAFPG